MLTQQIADFSVTLTADNVRWSENQHSHSPGDLRLGLGEIDVRDPETGRLVQKPVLMVQRFEVKTLERAGVLYRRFAWVSLCQHAEYASLFPDAAGFMLN